MNGVINVNKPKGFTSSDVVAKLRGMSGGKKAGHTGTLDPDATGVLPVCFGNATKACGLLTDEKKTYAAQMTLGITTDTLDTTGSVTAVYPVQVNREEITAAVMSFLGEQLQTPPMYSAIKQNGRKLYDIARAGEEVYRAPRKVMFYGIEINEIDLSGEPLKAVVRFTVTCSRGTYIRSLCDDIGRKLGTGAAMSDLVRTRVGIFTLENALTLDELQAMKDAGHLADALFPTEQLFLQYPAFTMHQEKENLALCGSQIGPEDGTFESASDGSIIRVRRADGTFIALYQYRKERRWYQPYQMFLPSP